MTKSILAGVVLVVAAGTFFLITRLNTSVVPTASTTPPVSTTSVEKNIHTQTATPATPNGAQSNTILTLSSGGMTRVSQDIFVRTELTSLDVSHNQLKGSLPGEVRHLINLTTLDLSYNAFTGVPAEIGQLTKLTSLNLSHNPITGLPLELGNLTHLKVLDLSATQYSKTDLEQIRKKLPVTTVIITK